MQKYFLKSLFVILLILGLGLKPCYASVLFDAVDDTIDFGNICTNWSAFTIASWVFLTAGQPDAGEFPVMADCEDSVDDGSRGGFGWFHLDTGIINLRIRAEDNSNENEVSATAPTSGQWNHLAVTYNDGANTVIFYLNGVADGSRTNSITMGDSGEDFLLGDLNDTGFPMNGQMQDTALWNTDLSADEILQLASSRGKGMYRQIQTDSFVTLQPLDDCPDGTSGDGVTFVDISGKGNDGTGVDGANNTGLTCKGTEHLTYP